jgi:hypothetical protein
MAITNLDGLVAAMAASTRQKINLNKASITGLVAGGASSYFRSVGVTVGQGTVPTTAATCNNTTLGGAIYTNPTGASLYIARATYLANSAQTTEMHDRLAHMGGLSGIVTTAQTVGVDLLALAGTDNIAQRKGRADYSNVLWFLEWYTATGSTATVATITYTNHLGTTGKTTTVSVPATTAAGRLIPIVALAGDYIRSIESVTLSVTSGTAGNFGVTATVEKTMVMCSIANYTYTADWSQLGLPQIFDSSCLTFHATTTQTSSGAMNGSVLLVQG